MNKNKLTSICHKIADKTGLEYNEVQVYYFLETVLRQIAYGPYKNHFIFKGGFVLSNYVGIKTRCTVDIDCLLRDQSLTRENIDTILRSSLISQDNITYEIQNVKPIKEDDAYGGFRASIKCRLENIEQTVKLDIATGDIVTPHPVRYEFESIFSDDKVPIRAYTLETIIAEKLETLTSKGFFNSRSKDYYDLYIIYKLKSEEIDYDILKEAMERTFKYRNTKLDYDSILLLLQEISSDSDHISRWEAYKRKNIYVTSGFADTVKIIAELVRLIKDWE